MSALWGLAQWEWALRVHACAPGFPHGADLNPQACANLLAEGACGAAASARSSPASWMR